MKNTCIRRTFSTSALDEFNSGLDLKGPVHDVTVLANNDVQFPNYYQTIDISERPPTDNGALAPSVCLNLLGVGHWGLVLYLRKQRLRVERHLRLVMFSHINASLFGYSVSLGLPRLTTTGEVSESSKNFLLLKNWRA